MFRDLLNDVGYRLRALFRRADAERAMATELQFHLDREIERLVREGATLAEATRRARIDFGGVEQVKESARDAWGVRFIEDVRRDFVQSLRLGAKQPGFSAVVIVSLALGLAATLTIVNIEYNVLLAPLPSPQPRQLVSMWRWNKDGRDDSFRWSEIAALRATPGVEIAAMRGASAVSFRAGDQRAGANVDFLDGNFFEVLRAHAARGQVFSPRDDSTAAPVVVLSHDFATQLFGSDSAAVGGSVDIRGAAFTVIGVMPASYRGVRWPGRFTAAIPMGAVSLLGAIGVGSDNRGNSYGRGDDRLSDRTEFQFIGRITGDMDAVSASLASGFARCCSATVPGKREWLQVTDMSRGIEGGKGDIRRDIRVTLVMILVGVVLILVVVCCNIAGLLLVRATARQREIAIRLSLGASRARLAWQLISESLPLSIAGGIGGLTLAIWFTSGFVRQLPSDWDELTGLFRFTMNPFMIGASVALTGLCVAVFAVYPALRATGRPLAMALRADSRASRTPSQGAVARSVIVAQVAVTVVLVTATALVSSSLKNMSYVDAGVETDRTLLAGLESRSTTYEATGVVPVAEGVARAVEQVAGVRSVTMATSVPLYGGSNYSVQVEVPGFTYERGREPYARLIVARRGYFATTGLRLTRGVDFGATSPGEALVNEAFVAKFLKGRDPVGQSFSAKLDGRDATPFTPLRVVGVTADVPYESIKENPRPIVYTSLDAEREKWSTIQLVVRTTGTPASTARAVLAAIEGAAAGMTVRRVRDMETQRAYSTTTERLTARLALFVSAMALALAVIGLYGVVAYGVSRRTSEIGVRLALGARPRSVLWLVSRETVVIMVVGVAIGSVLSYGANAMIKSQLFGVSPHDLQASLAAVFTLAIAGLAASLLPARRATRIDPKIALNAD